MLSRIGRESVVLRILFNRNFSIILIILIINRKYLKFCIFKFVSFIYFISRILYLKPKCQSAKRNEPKTKPEARRPPEKERPGGFWGALCRRLARNSLLYALRTGSREQFKAGSRYVRSNFPFILWNLVYFKMYFEISTILVQRICKSWLMMDGCPAWLAVPGNQENMTVHAFQG